MPHFIIERNVGDVSPEDMQQAGKKSVEVLEGMPGVQWIRSYVSYEEGKVYCEYYAPDRESLIEHARRGGFPIDRIVEVGLEMCPAMFR